MPLRLSPAPRLLLALVLALAVVGAAAYLLMANALHDDQIDTYQEALSADAKSIEVATRHLPMPVAIREVDEVLDTIGSRPGTEEALLIGPDRVIRASATDSLVGSRDEDPKTIAALDRGVASVGKEADPGEPATSFEFVYPVELPNGRYALEVAYSSAAFDAQLSSLLRILAFTVLGAIGAIVVLFYLLGGRSLLRSHRVALQRATRDGLTDLPNHRAFQDDLEQAAAAAVRNEDPLALAMIDVDQFKLVNDRHGHQEGDSLLKRLAASLRQGRSADRPYRIGGDEFAVILATTDERGARTVTNRLARMLKEERLAVSIGVAALRPGGSVDELRAEADAALYEAKRRGGSRALLFSDIGGHAAVTTAAKREAVRRLIDEGRLATVFQPIWRFESGQLLGVEALTRPDPVYGLSGPAEAFDVAEGIGRVHELDVLCATRALAAAQALPEDALLFLNLAPKTLELDVERGDWLLSAVEASDLPVERIVLEVTERIEANTGAVIEALHRLRDEGFKLAIDDVGTGNAGLEMLRRIGADYVKIDRSIVVAATTEPNARAVLLAMATFARQTGAFVIAEGVEDAETLEFVRAIEAAELPPGAIVQGGQGFELGGPARELPRWHRVPSRLA